MPKLDDSHFPALLRHSRNIEPLIPGLPDDVALNCLLHVSLDNHPACKKVCKRWRSLFRSTNRFFTKRRELGFLDPWLFILTSDKNTRNLEWKVLDLARFTWHSIPPMPIKENSNSNSKISPQGFICASIPSDGVLYVCGGVISDADSPLNLVLKYELVENRWTKMKKMASSRSFFASGVIEGTIYVAGGNGPELFELNSAEAFDTKTGRWKPISNMCANLASYDSAVVDGKLLVTEGWLWPFNVRPIGQIYDPLIDRWESMGVGLREGWTGSSVVIDGRLFVVERERVKVYERESDCWWAVEGGGLPEMICRPFCVSSWGFKIYVVGLNLRVAIGNVMRSFGGFCVEWRLVDANETLVGLTPSNAEILLG